MPDALDPDDEFWGDRLCPDCEGDGMLFQADASGFDPINDNPTDIVTCPCCRGSGLRKDCIYDR